MLSSWAAEASEAASRGTAIADVGCLMPKWRYLGYASSLSGECRRKQGIASPRTKRCGNGNKGAINIAERSNPVAELARLDLNIGDPVAAYYDRVNLELYSDDAMYAGNDRHYLECGASGLQVVLAALQIGRHMMPSSILSILARAQVE